MRIGVRGHDYGMGTPKEIAAKISETGFCCLQLALHKSIKGFLPEYGHLNPGFAYDVRSAFEQRGLEIAVLGCYIEPGTQNEELRQNNISRFLEQLSYCKMLGSNIVATETSGCTDSDREKQYDLLLDSVRLMVKRAESFGVFVGIEPVWCHTLNTPELTGRLLNDISSPNLQIVFDPFNLIAPGKAGDQHRLIDAAFDIFGDRIVAVHAKDAVEVNGSFKSCLIGEGFFDHAYFYKKLNRIKPGISVLREGADPLTAKLDIIALEKYSQM
ncbi:MAG: sugar phosphate isomerase/epimerase [Clostridiales bacterium]|nr:sugar phosphate isomerase/epimerase [Clostridiales bacterium]